MPSNADLELDSFTGVSQINGINAQSALNSVSPALKLPSGMPIRSVSVAIKGSAGIASGAVVLEGSLDPPSTVPGAVVNWMQMIAPVNAVASVATPIFEAVAPVIWVRTRISTVITGGTISTDIVASGRS